jgi:hypothetical protein
VELPVCWAYCLQSELACGGAALASQACTKGVAVRVRQRAGGRCCRPALTPRVTLPRRPQTHKAGRVAPDRPDVQCMSCAGSAPMLLLPLLLLALATTSAA